MSEQAYSSLKRVVLIAILACYIPEDRCFQVAGYA